MGQRKGLRRGGGGGELHDDRNLPYLIEREAMKNMGKPLQPIRLQSTVITSHPLSELLSSLPMLAFIFILGLEEVFIFQYRM